MESVIIIFYENDLIHYVGAGKTLSVAADSDVLSWFLGLGDICFASFVMNHHVLEQIINGANTRYWLLSDE